MIDTAIAATAFAVGLGLIATAFVKRPARTEGKPLGFGHFLVGLLPNVKEKDEQNLRLVGVTPQAYATQRFVGLAGGLSLGLFFSFLLGVGLVGALVTVILVTAVGWFLPLLGVRDTARRARVELDQVVRAWIVLVAQQVSAGANPSTAMLVSAQVGQLPSWRLLYRFLLVAQHERRPVWQGLDDMVSRYGLSNLNPIVSSLGLATERGTRLSEAVVAAAKTLWDDTISNQREVATRRSQLVVVPATGVALALAGILVYPPFTTLTGGGIGGL